MQKPTYKELLDAGCHFGHLRKKWNPKMTPYIFMEHKGIHIIDLNRTAEMHGARCPRHESHGKKRQKNHVRRHQKTGTRHRAKSSRKRRYAFRNRTLAGWYDDQLHDHPQVGEKNAEHRAHAGDTTLTSITKKERLTLSREHTKMNKHLGGIEQLNRLPSAVFIVDIHHEHLALAEAKKLGVQNLRYGRYKLRPNPGGLRNPQQRRRFQSHLFHHQLPGRRHP